MVFSPDKCSFILFGTKDELQTDLVSNKVTVKNSREEKKLEIILMANFSSPRI